MKKYILCNTLLEHEGLYINRNCSNYGYRGGLSDAQSTCALIFCSTLDLDPNSGIEIRKYLQRVIRYCGYTVGQVVVLISVNSQLDDASKMGNSHGLSCRPV